MDITGFYHTSAWQPHWKEVITEQLLLLDGRNKTGASLLNATSTLHIVIADQNPQNYSIIKTHMESLPLHYANKIQYMFNQTIGRMAFKSASKEERKVLR